MQSLKDVTNFYNKAIHVIDGLCTAVQRDNVIVCSPVNKAQLLKLFSAWTKNGGVLRIGEDQPFTYDEHGIPLLNGVPFLGFYGRVKCLETLHETTEEILHRLGPRKG